MAYAVTAGLDAAGTKGLAHLRAVLTAAGVPEPATGLGFRPNLTLAVYEDLDEPTAIAALDRIALQTPLLPALFAGVAVFPGRAANLWAAPSPDPRLLVLQRAVRAAIAGQIWELYRPEVWVPHCTLATNLDPAHIGAATQAATQAWTPFEGVFVTLDLVRFAPIDVLWQRDLQSEA